MSNFDALMFTLFAVAVLTTLLRLFIRGSVLRTIGLDDVLAVLATLMGAAMCAFEHLKILANNRYLEAVRAGAPVKSGPSVLGLLTESDRMTLFNQVTYVAELCLIKCAILAFYRRITIEHKHRYAQYALGFCIIAFTVAFIVATFLGRDPPKAVWYPYDPRFPSPDRCSCAVLAVANSSLQALFDIVILAFPVWFFRKLMLTRRIKLGLMFIYALAFFSLVATLIRLAQSVQYLLIDDFLEQRETLMIFSVWTVVETNTALICANLPALSAFFKWAYRKQTSRGKQSYPSGSEAPLARKAWWGVSRQPEATGPEMTGAWTSYGSGQDPRTFLKSTQFDSGGPSLHLPIQNP